MSRLAILTLALLLYRPCSNADWSAIRADDLPSESYRRKQEAEKARKAAEARQQQLEWEQRQAAELRRMKQEFQRQEQQRQEDARREQAQALESQRREAAQKRADQVIEATSNLSQGLYRSQVNLPC
jgi:hypothetical protein